MGSTALNEWTTEEGILLVRKWKRAGLSNKQIAERIGISESTFYEWKKESQEFSESLKKTKEVCDADAEEALISMFGGQYVNEEKTEQWIENGTIKKEHVFKTKRYIPGNVTAVIFYLKARAGWSENPIIEGKTAEILESLQDLMRGNE